MWMSYLERACRYQVEMLSCGRELTQLSEETQEVVIEQGRQLFGNGALDSPGTQWPALIRKLERESGSDWRI